jgi:hypothetical protein
LKKAELKKLSTGKVAICYLKIMIAKAGVGKEKACLRSVSGRIAGISGQAAG